MELIEAITKSLHWRWGVEYDYSSVTHCDEENNPCDYMHRCSTIEDARVTHTNKERLGREIIGKTDDPIIAYCADRLICTNKDIGNPENYTVHVSGGYYGEEIDDVSYDMLGELCRLVEQMLSQKTDDDRIKFVINQEYGYLLDSLKTSKFSIEMLSPADVFIPNDTYEKKLNRDLIASYLQVFAENFPKAEKNSIHLRTPLFLVNEKRKLIDGYHRHAAALAYLKEHPEFQCAVLVASPEK